VSSEAKNGRKYGPISHAIRWDRNRATGLGEHWARRSTQSYVEGSKPQLGRHGSAIPASPVQDFSWE
jgi:hypothetical protein